MTERGINTAAASTVKALSSAGLRLATAESCTGGLIAKLITDIPGSSDVFSGGIVSYANEVKMSVLGVRAETLASHGAVSEKTALEMADGARHVCGADIAISTTGIAGPGGGTPEKPVGTVWIAISHGGSCEAHRLRHPEDAGRDEIRNETAKKVLELITKTIETQYKIK